MFKSSPEPFTCGSFISEFLGKERTSFPGNFQTPLSLILQQTWADYVLGSPDNPSLLNVFLIGEPTAPDHVPSLPEG